MTPGLPIVAIHGAPRSGTSWLGQLFNSSPCVAYRFQPLFAHAFRGRVDAGSKAGDLDRFFSDLLATTDPFVLQAEGAALARTMPAFDKARPTHLAYKEVRFHDVLPHFLATVPRLKAIGLVRDPRAVIASWYRAPREFDPAWSLAEEWRQAPRKNAGLPENWFGFERWKELAGLFLQLQASHADRFRLVRYEELQRDPLGVLRALFDFCGLAMGPQTHRFVDASSAIRDDDPYGVFRAREAGRSPPVLDGDVGASIEAELRGTPLARFLDRPEAC